MSEVLRLFQSLSQFFHPNLLWEQIEEIYEKSQEEDSSDEDEASSDDTDQNSDSDEAPIHYATPGTSRGFTIKSVKTIPIVKRAVRDSQVLSILQELSTAIRNLRDTNNGYDNTYDCWDRVIERAPRDSYLAFIYALLGLSKIKPTSKIHRKLSMAAASAYILSLTIPGSKGFHIFEDKIICQALEVFNLINIVRDETKPIAIQDKVEIWVNFSSICDDFKLLFRYVHFDECKDIRNSILWQLNKLLYNNHLYGYENIYAASLHSKCFEIYDEVINAHNGDPEETLMKIMRISYCLHIFPPTPKRRESLTAGANSQLCEHVSEWFIKIITKYPRVVSKVLRFYIECVVTNPEKEWRIDHIQRALEYATKYDAALYTKCNESIIPYLSEVCLADDVQARTNATELLSRIVLFESKVNWEVFRHEVSNTPREALIIKELINRMLDVNNSIKLKALHGFYQAYLRGTRDAVTIIKEGIRFSSYEEEAVCLPEEPRSRLRELRYKKPEAVTPAYTFEGYELIQPTFKRLPKILYYLFQSSAVNVRKAAVTLIEPVVVLNPLVIYQTDFVKECSKLGDDPAAMVRKQALQTIDSILGSYPNCYPIIYTWCKIIVPLFKDNDQKTVSLAWEFFKRRVFDNINGIDKSNKPEHFMPWIILRVLLTTQQRHFLQTCINAAISKQMINEKVITLIESHTLTANSTEAWTMLSFVAGKVKSKEPDSLISSFIKSLLEQSWNAGHNLHIILEVLAICIRDFSHTALNMAFSNIVNLMKRGTIPPNVVSKAFNFCMTICCQSQHKRDNNNRNKTNKDEEFDKRTRNMNQLKWVTDIHNTAEKYLIENLQHFSRNRKVIMSFLFIYTEANIELPVRPHDGIISFVYKFLKEYVETRDSDFESEDITTVNQMIILGSRFSIRDPNVANKMCGIYRQILKKTDRPTTVNNVIVCLTDLCKRHTQIVELHLGEVMIKLKSSYLEIRLVSFTNLAQLVLQDVLKLRGNLLICLLTCLLDREPQVSNRATEFFLSYLEKKNPMLFQTCLLECPFVFNGYMHFEEFENFSDLEQKFESPLKGNENAKSRQMLYKVFIFEQEEIFLLAFFDNLKLILGKIRTDNAIKSNEGCSVIKDMLYILKHICLLGLEKKNTSHQPQESEETEETPVIDTAQPSTSNSEVPQGRRRKRNQALTMNQAISIVEKSICLLPKIAEIVLEWDNSFQKPVDDLAVAICLRFENIAEFAQPAIYWEKYRRISKEHSTPSRKRKSDSFFTESDQDDDDDEIPANRSRWSDDASISLLFQPLFAGL